MNNAKFVPILLILLIFGIQAFISCATGIDEEEYNSNSNKKSSSSRISGSSSSAGGGGTSSSTTSPGGSSSSIGGGSSSSSFKVWSSGSESESWQEEWLEACPGTEPKKDTIIYGEDLTDSRNGGKTYKTVIIGTQTWMESNLNYEPDSPSGITKCYAEGYGYDTWLSPEEAKPNCDKYGRLYDWATALDLPANCETNSCGSQVRENHQGVCPSGWHIPSRDEWNVLKEYIEDIIFCKWQDDDYGWDVGTKLKAASGWKSHHEHGNGVDIYGFNAIGSGYCYNCTQSDLSAAAGNYAGITNRGNGDGESAYWWTATEYANASIKGNAWRFKISYDSNVLVEKHENKSDLYSIRCVKD